MQSLGQKGNVYRISGLTYVSKAELVGHSMNCYIHTVGAQSGHVWSIHFLVILFVFGVHIPDHFGLW